MNTDRNTLIERLKNRLRAPLPGHDAFLELSGYRRPDLATAMNRDPRPVESGVLILLYPEDGTLRTMLMLRPSYDGVHSGHVGFPGGHRETKDGSIMVTALRSEGYIVTGLRQADDYVCKPFSIGELVARLNAVMRRASNQTRTRYA